MNFILLSLLHRDIHYTTKRAVKRVTKRAFAKEDDDEVQCFKIEYHEVLATAKWSGFTE
jgi:hypothetical protein